MKSFLLAVAAAACLSGGAAQAQVLTPMSMLTLEELPTGGRWVEMATSERAIYFLQWPVVRDGQVATGIIYEVLDEPADVGGAEMATMFMGRAARCDAGTIADLGIIGFDEDGRTINAAPAEGGFKAVPEGSAEAMIATSLCDANFKPEGDMLMTLEEAGEEADYYFLAAALKQRVN